MACEHPQINWVGTSDGIHCGLCGALVNIGATKKEATKVTITTKSGLKIEDGGPEPVKDPEPEDKPVKKPVLKRGGKK